MSVVVEILPYVLRSLLILGFLLLTIGVWRGRLTPAGFAALVAGWLGVFILVSVPFETASRLVVAGIEIDSRVQRAEQILEQIQATEARLKDVEVELTRLENASMFNLVELRIFDLTSRLEALPRDGTADIGFVNALRRQLVTLQEQRESLRAEL